MNIKKINNQYVYIHKGEKITITNFTWNIIKDSILESHDGTRKHTYTISGINKKGELLPPILIKAEDYYSKWESKWGTKAIVFERSLYNNLILIQNLMSDGIIHDITYEFVGLVQNKNEKPFFVDNGGSIYHDGYDPKIRSNLNGKLNNFKLPKPTTNLTYLQKCIRCCLQFDKISSSNKFLGRLLIMAPVLALLSFFIEITLSLFLEGVTGSRKSALLAVSQAFYGAVFSKQTQLPINWESTANSLEETTIIIKNSLLVIDEYTPKNKINLKELTIKAERVFRGLANKSVRQRCNPDGTTDQIRTSGAFVLAAGESIPQNVVESLLNRIVFFSISKDDINNTQLSKFQKLAGKGSYAQVTASMIQDMLKRFAYLEVNLPKKFLKFRDEATTLLHEIDPDLHARCPENMALMMTALYFFYHFAMKKKVISREQFDQYCVQAWDDLTALILEQKAIFAEPTRLIFFL